MRFEFAPANRNIFSPGTLQEATPVIVSFGSHLLLVYW